MNNVTENTPEAIDLTTLTCFPGIETCIKASTHVIGRPGMPKAINEGLDWRIAEVITVNGAALVREELHGWSHTVGEIGEAGPYTEYYISVAPGYRDSRLVKLDPRKHVV